MAPETIVAQVSLGSHRARDRTEDVRHLALTATDKIRKAMSFSQIAWNNKFASNEYELVMKKDGEVPLKLYMETGEVLGCNRCRHLSSGV